MSKLIKVLLVLSSAGVLLFYGIQWTNNTIKEQVAEQLISKYGIEHSGVNIGLWKGSILVDSISGFGNSGKISTAKIIDLSWYKLYRTRHIGLDNLCFKIKDFSSWTEDGLHRITIGSAVKRGEKMTIKDMRIFAPLSVESFMNKLDHRKPRFTIIIPEMEVTGISENPFHAKLIRIENASIKVDEDLNLPISNTKKKLLVEILQDIEQRFLIDNLMISKSHLEYTVKDNGSNQRGGLKFTGLQLSVSNITNDSLSIARENTMIIDMKTALENDGQMNVVMKHFLDSPTHQYDVYATIKDFSLTNANNIITAAKDLRITQGHLNLLKVSGSFHDHFGSGEIDLDYKDLKINVNRKFEKIVNLVGNAVVKNDIKENQSFSESRNTNKSFLAHLWLSVVEAMKKVILNVSPDILN